MKGKIIDRPKKRLNAALVLAFCVFFTAVSLHSAAFVFVNDGHSHECGDSSAKKQCAVCVHLFAAKSLLNFIFLTAIKTLLIFSILRVVPLVLKPVCFYTDFLTPVRLKVRLNN